MLLRGVNANGISWGSIVIVLYLCRIANTLLWTASFNLFSSHHGNHSIGTERNMVMNNIIQPKKGHTIVLRKLKKIKQLNVMSIYSWLLFSIIVSDLSDLSQWPFVIYNQIFVHRPILHHSFVIRFFFYMNVQYPIVTQYRCADPRLAWWPGLYANRTEWRRQRQKQQQLHNSKTKKNNKKKEKTEKMAHEKVVIEHQFEGSYIRFFFSFF